MSSYESTDCQNLWCCGLVSPKNILIISKNFLNFWFDVIKKQSIKNLSRYGSKVYASVFVDDSEVTFLGKEEDSVFYPSLFCVLVIYSVAVLKLSSNFLVFHTSGDISVRPAAFLFLIFVITMLSFSWGNCFSLMSSWLLMIFICLSVALGEFSSSFLKSSFHNCIHSSWLEAFNLAFKILFLIMLCRQHGYLWPSLATSPHRLSPLAGLRGYIPYPHITAVCIFRLVVLLLLGHMWGSIGVRCLWIRPCFSSSVLCVWFI